MPVFVEKREARDFVMKWAESRAKKSAGGDLEKGRTGSKRS